MAQTLGILVAVGIIALALTVRGTSLLVAENEARKRRVVRTLRALAVLFCVVFIGFAGVGLWMNDYVWLSAGIAAGSAGIGAEVQREIILREGGKLKEYGKELHRYSGFMFVGLFIALIIIIVKNV